MTKIPSEYLYDLNADVGSAFRATRKAIENAGPLDYASREYLMLASFAAAGYEESFRIHALRALKRGLQKDALQQAVLVPLGATLGLLPVVQALKWIEEASAQLAVDPWCTGSVPSSDGTRISYSRYGSGPALLVVHGASSERSRWVPVMSPLGCRFTVYAMDRRGRGQSVDTGNYAIEREVDDIAAVINSIGGSVDVIAHSYGAICALEATRLTSKVRRLVLYEPPIAVEEPTPEEATTQERFIGELEAHLARGDRAAVLDAFFQRNLGMSPEETTALRSSVNWQDRLALAHTLPRELREVRRYRFTPSRFSDYSVPTLFVLGGESPRRHKRCAEMLSQSLAGSKLAVLAGHGHRAIDTAPALFSATVLDFLKP